MVIDPSQSETATLDLGACFFSIYLFIYFFRFGGEFVPNCSIFRRLTFWPGKSETRGGTRALACSLARAGTEPDPSIDTDWFVQRDMSVHPSGTYAHGGRGTDRWNLAWDRREEETD